MVRNGGSAVCGGFKHNKKQLHDYFEHFNLAKFNYLREHTNKLPCLRVTRWYFLEDENEIGRYHSAGVPF